MSVTREQEIKRRYTGVPMSALHAVRGFCLWVGLDLVVLFVLLGVLAALVVAYGATLHIMWNTLILAGVYLVGNTSVALLLRWLWHRGAMRFSAEALGACRDWIPFTLLLIVYENLRLYTGFIRPDSLDAGLAALDLRLWGVQPTVWAQQFAHPVLTDLMAIAYALHFPLPLSLLLGLYAADRRSCFRELACAMVCCIVSGFILYLSFPAGPPRFYLTAMYDPPRLPTWTGLYEWTDRTFDYANQLIIHSSFPSLHVSFAMIALMYAFRRDHWPRSWRWMGPLYTFLGIALGVSTIYLRHHWTPDLAAGVALGLFSVLVARGMNAWAARHLDSLRSGAIKESGASA